MCVCVCKKGSLGLLLKHIVPCSFSSQLLFIRGVHRKKCVPHVEGGSMGTSIKMKAMNLTLAVPRLNIRHLIP